ncbi:MAG: hypothetical protein AB1742_09875 [bacterium]
MWLVSVHALKFLFQALAIFATNYIIIIGLRDILYFILPMGRPAKPRLKKPPAARLFSLNALKRLVFWTAFAGAALFLFQMIIPFAAFIAASCLLFRLAERGRLSAGALTLACSILLTGVTSAYVASQPVLIRFDDRLSVDLWIYNSSNSFIDVLIAASQRMRMDPSGLERLAALVPHVQKNIFSLLYLTLYLLCGFLLSWLARIILPGTEYKAPPYYGIAPVRLFAPAAAAVFAWGNYANVTQAQFIVGGIYYIWGVNALVFAAGGCHWTAGLFIAAAGALHPASIGALIALGVADNLLDVRRLCAVLGVRRRPQVPRSQS